MKAKHFIIVILLWTISLTTAGCSRKSSSEEGLFGAGNNNNVMTRLNFYFWTFGSQQAYTDEVVKEIEKRTSSSLNIKLNIKYVPYIDYEKTIQKLLYSGDSIDAYTDSLSKLSKIIRENKLKHYKDLSVLFPQYAPEIYNRYSIDELAEAEYEGKLYALPAKKKLNERMYVLVRDDIMKKYNLKDISTLEGYEAYLEKAASEGLSYATGLTSFVIKAYMESKGYIEYEHYGLFYNRNDNEIRLTPMENLDEYHQAVGLVRRWAQKGYIEPSLQKSVAIHNDSSFNSLITQFDIISSCMTDRVIPVRYYALYPDAFTSKVSDVRSQAMFFSSASKVVPRALQFINWVGRSQENYDLVMYGLKGKDYNLENGRVKLLENNSQLYYRSIIDKGAGMFFKYIDMNRPVGLQPVNYWKTYRKELNRMCEADPLSGFRYLDVSEDTAAALLKERISRFRELEENIFSTDYEIKLEDFKRQQKQAGIDNLLNTLELKAKQWKASQLASLRESDGD